MEPCPGLHPAGRTSIFWLGDGWEAEGRGTFWLCWAEIDILDPGKFSGISVADIWKKG